jgi:hypothetical protein
LATIDPEMVEAEAAAILATEAELAADKTKNGRVRFSRWRMTHAVCHSNVQPGKYGEPMFEHDFEDQILDALHLAQLGVPKTPWKHGVLNNASDDAREATSDQLAEWCLPLDTKRKDAGRQRVQKWFTLARIGQLFAQVSAVALGVRSPSPPSFSLSLMDAPIGYVLWVRGCTLIKS